MNYKGIISRNKDVDHLYIEYRNKGFYKIMYSLNLSFISKHIYLDKLDESIIDNHFNTYKNIDHIECVFKIIEKPVKVGTEFALVDQTLNSLEKFASIVEINIDKTLIDEASESSRRKDKEDWNLIMVDYKKHLLSDSNLLSFIDYLQQYYKAPIKK